MTPGSPTTGPDGVLVIDKPAGMTSHDVVDDIRRRFNAKKVGHAGTLDPDATGLLVVGIGRATRFLSYSQGAPKRYTAVARFGSSTTTQDASGEVTERRPARLTESDVTSVLPEFTGRIEQVPPMVSAVKIAGERLYAKARRGEEVERSPRTVTIHRLEVMHFTPGVEPEATLDVTCSAGTFVRTLVHDLGGRLECGAHVRTLRRTEAGGFSTEDATALELIGPPALRPLSDVVRFLEHIELGAPERVVVANGGALPLGASHPLGEGMPVALLAGGELMGVYVRRGEKLVADRVVPQ